MGKSSIHHLKLGMCLNELYLPFDHDQALGAAREMGVEYVWFADIPDWPAIADMSDAEVDRMGESVAEHGFKFMYITAGSPFKLIHLTDLTLDSMQDNPAFRKDFDDLVRSMQIAARLGVGAVAAHTFAWPGEYSAGKPTWPMRWLTRGGVIADVDMEKLVKAFTLVTEQADTYGLDVVLTMMPWNYTNTTSNFRLLAERLASPRIKVMWGPADNYNCGEWDVATNGFNNVRPFLHSIHIKDLHVFDGLRLKFEYRPLGQGDVDLLTVLRNLRDQSSDVVLSLSTHFRPPSGSRLEAMRINHANLMALLQKVEQEA